LLPLITIQVFCAISEPPFAVVIELIDGPVPTSISRRSDLTACSHPRSYRVTPPCGALTGTYPTHALNGPFAPSFQCSTSAVLMVRVCHASSLPAGWRCFVVLMNNWQCAASRRLAESLWFRTRCRRGIGAYPARWRKAHRQHCRLKPIRSWQFTLVFEWPGCQWFAARAT